MRVTSWNCSRGADVSRCLSLLAPLRSDLITLQESRRPAIDSVSVIWRGTDPRQGVAVVTAGPRHSPQHSSCGRPTRPRWCRTRRAPPRSASSAGRSRTSVDLRVGCDKNQHVRTPHAGPSPCPAHGRHRRHRSPGARFGGMLARAGSAADAGRIARRSRGWRCRLTLDARKSLPICRRRRGFCRRPRESEEVWTRIVASVRSLNSSGFLINTKRMDCGRVVCVHTCGSVHSPCRGVASVFRIAYGWAADEGEGPDWTSGPS